MQLTEWFQKLAPDERLAQTDMDWVENTTRRARSDTEKLEHELKTYKNNLIKESIRMGQEDLGSQYLRMGLLNDAFKAFSKMREYCTSQRQIAQMTFKLMYVAVFQRNWVIVASYQPKIAVLQLAPEEKTKFEPITYACLGLAQLQQSNYRDAAYAFLNVDQQYMIPEAQGGIFFQNSVMTPNDVAIYGGLCALATMDRAELVRRVLDNTSFRPLLELEPHIRRAISMFCSSKYKSCLQVLESYMADYLLDVYLQNHFLKLYQLVRSKCIVQWFSAYSRVTWDDIHAQFPNGLLQINLEDELVEMIKNGDLDARIDLVDKVCANLFSDEVSLTSDKVLVSPNPDSRITVIQDTLAMAKDTEHALRLRLHGINMKHSGFIVKSSNQGLGGFGEQNQDFFSNPMGIRGQGQGKMKKGSSGLGQAHMI